MPAGNEENRVVKAKGERRLWEITSSPGKTVKIGGGREGGGWEGKWDEEMGEEEGGRDGGVVEWMREGEGGRDKEMVDWMGEGEGGKDREMVEWMREGEGGRDGGKENQMEGHRTAVETPSE